jgi:hypothetical protein
MEYYDVLVVGGTSYFDWDRVAERAARRSSPHKLHVTTTWGLNLLAVQPARLV